MTESQIPDFTIVKAKREKAENVFDTRHAARDLDPLLTGEEVWVQDHNTSGSLRSETNNMC